MSQASPHLRREPRSGTDAANRDWLRRFVRLPSSRFTCEKSARYNRQADPFDSTDDGWRLEIGWEVVGWCENPPAWNKNTYGMYYVGLMLQAPDGNDYWWHWGLSRGLDALKDWRKYEWPIARQPNDKAEPPAKNL